MKDFVAEFREKSYQPLLRQLAEDTAKWLVGEEANLSKKFADDVEREVKCVADLQEQGLLPVTEILVSITYTSVYFGMPKLRLDFYAESWIVSDAVYSAYVDAAWLFRYWDDHVAALNDAAGTLRARVRKTHLESMQAQSVRLLGYLLAPRVKYWIRRIRDSAALAELKKGAEFYISFGEYMDWQKAIFAQLPEVDIFNCGTEDSLRFRSFFQCHYKNKKFAELDLSGSRFAYCVFEDCVFTETDLCDTVFESCRFIDTVAEKGFLSGAQFSDTVLHGLVLREMEASPNAMCGGRQDLYNVLSFDSCTLEAVTLMRCKLPGAVLLECLCEGIQIEDCDCTGSDFADFAANREEEEL